MAPTQRATTNRTTTIATMKPNRNLPTGDLLRGDAAIVPLGAMQDRRAERVRVTPALQPWTRLSTSGRGPRRTNQASPHGLDPSALR